MVPKIRILFLTGVVLAGVFVAGPVRAEARKTVPPKPASSIAATDSANSSAPLPMSPGDTLTFRDAVAAVLLYNPALKSCDYERRLRDVETLQAGLRPNPELEFEMENFGGSGDLQGFQGSEMTVSLGQLLETGQKRRKRVELARAESEWTVSRYEALRLELLTGAAKAYLELLAAQERVALYTELEGITRDMCAAVQRRVAAGSVSEAVFSQAQIEKSAAQIEFRKAVQELERARYQLASNWGSATPGFGYAAGDLNAAIYQPDEQKLFLQLDEHPDLVLLQKEILRQTAKLNLERSGRLPDPAVGAGIRRLNDVQSSAFVLNFSLPLPLFDRNQYRTAAAATTLEQAHFQRRMAEEQLRSEIYQQYRFLLGTLQELTTLRDSMLPEAERAFEIYQRAYESGRNSFLEVLNAQRTLFELRSRYLDVLTAYHIARTDLERLTGQPLESIDIRESK